MTEIAKRILAVFAESYPTSAYYKGGRRLRKSGWEKLFPRITTDVAAKTEFLDAVEELLSAKILSARWKRFRDGDDLEALYLEDPQALFNELDLPSPETVARQMLELLARPEWASGELAGLVDYLAPRLQAGHPVPVRNAAELEDLARLFSLTPQDAAACSIRALSVRLYADSKRLERLMPVADRLSRSMGKSPLSEKLALGRSYPEVSLALFGRLAFAGCAAPWLCHGQILTLPAVSVALIEAVTLEARGPSGKAASGQKVILSVENKETFHLLAGGLNNRLFELPSPIAGTVYTGGHPNDAVKAFLRRCVAAGACLYHYGDLDPDGLLILQEIQAALAVPVVPWCMTAAIHRRYAKHGYTLDKTQTTRLSLLDANAPEELRNLAREIEKTGIGVEQEIIDIGINSWDQNR
jgi:Protein of unknown function C-terminus (DUF2399)